MNFKYLSGAIISLPLLPLMFYQGKKISANVPRLPEAGGTEGYCESTDKTDRILKVISIGESTIAGVGVKTHEEGFTGNFASELSRLFECNVSWKVYAQSGYTAKMVEKNLLPKITESEVDLVIVGLGANDAFTLNRPSKWKTHIRTLIESLRQKFPKTTIVFCNMPPIKEFPAFTSLIKFTIGNLVEILGDELEKVSREYEQVFYFGEKITLKGWMDRYQLAGEKDDFFSDGVHPSKLTYQIWGIDIANKIYANEIIKTALKD